MSLPVKVAPAKLLQVVFMDAVLVFGGLALSIATGNFLWLFIGVGAGMAVVVGLLVLPALRAAGASRKEDRIVQ